MSKWAACRKWDTGNDPETLKLAFHQGPTLINPYFRAATNLSNQDTSMSKEACALQAKLLQTQIWVMICLNQEGLRSPSASKYTCVTLVLVHIDTFPKPFKQTSQLWNIFCSLTNLIWKVV